jgi:hypothetical protein
LDWNFINTNLKDVKGVKDMTKKITPIKIDDNNGKSKECEIEGYDLEIVDGNNIKLVKDYQPFSNMIVSEASSNKETSILKKDDYYDEENTLYKIASVSAKTARDFPKVDNYNILLKSLVKHDDVLMDLLGTLFSEYKHINSEATDKVYNMLSKLFESLSINEREKRNPIFKFLKNKGV